MRRITTLLLFFVAVFLNNVVFTTSYDVEPGPRVKATKGEVWPIPKTRIVTQKYFIVTASSFTFKVSTH